MADAVQMAFKPEGIMVPIGQILPVRTVRPEMRKGQQYQRLFASIRELGVIEPLIIFPQDSSDGRDRRYTLLDGHFRLDVLKELGRTEAFCLIAKDDEGFTYNHKVNRMAPIQEHFMILRALDNGVTEERIAATLSVDVKLLRLHRRALGLHELVKEAGEQDFAGRSFDEGPQTRMNSDAVSVTGGSTLTFDLMSGTSLSTGVGVAAVLGSVFGGWMAIVLAAPLLPFAALAALGWAILRGMSAAEVLKARITSRREPCRRRRCSGNSQMPSASEAICSVPSSRASSLPQPKRPWKRPRKMSPQ